MSATCIHCGHQVDGHLQLKEGAVCWPCYHHQFLHQHILEHRELHTKAKPELIPLEEPDEPLPAVTRPREYTVGGVVFKETGERRPVKPQGEWVLVSNGISAFLPNPTGGSTGSFSILRPVRVVGST